jgi:hypothetical protein
MPQPLAAARQARHHCADRDAQSPRRLSVREILDPDQQQHRTLFLGQTRKGAEQIPLLECPMLAAIDSRQLGRGCLQRCASHAALALAVPLT